MIEKLEIVKFGGLKSQSITFGPGLNVLYGANEAGKSTVVEALYGLLFVPAKIKKNKVADREFSLRAFPYGSEDGAHAILEVRDGDGHFKVDKYWHSLRPAEYYFIDEKELSDGESWLKGYLGYGEGTYRHIVFSRQDDIKKVFHNIKGDLEVSENLNQFLKNTKVHLDGLSIEGYKDVLNRRYQALVSNWDLERGWPVANKGLDHPHKRNVGDILSRYYEMSTYERELQYAEKTEAKREAIQKKWFETKSKWDILREEIEKAEVYEADLELYEKLSAERERLKESYQEALVVNKEWPVLISKIEDQRTLFSALKNEIDAMNDTIKIARGFQKTRLDYARVLEAESMLKKIEELEHAHGGHLKYSNDAIEALESLDRNVSKLGALLSASRLSGVLTMGSETVYVTDAFGTKSQMLPLEPFESPAYIKFDVGTVATIEIRSKEVDYDSIKLQLEKSKMEWEHKLEALEVSSLLEAKQKHETLKKIASELKTLQKQLERYPTLEERQIIKEEFSRGPQDIESIEILDDRLKVTTTKFYESKDILTRLESKHEIWTGKYHSHDRLIETLTHQMMAEKNIEHQLIALKKPETELSNEAFLMKLKMDRVEASKLSAQERDAERELLEVTSQLSERSVEELKIMYQSTRFEMERLISKAKKLNDIIQSFHNCVERFMNLGTSAFESTMNDYIRTLTTGRYNQLNMTPDHEVEVLGQGTILPLDLLSSGTMDAVALSFKLAMSAYMNNRGLKLTVLDDVLMNLDEERMNQAIEVIVDHARTHQVIFITCHEAIANRLGGKRIAL